MEPFGRNYKIVGPQPILQANKPLMYHSGKNYTGEKHFKANPTFKNKEWILLGSCVAFKNGESLFSDYLSFTLIGASPFGIWLLHLQKNYQTPNEFGVLILLLNFLCLQTAKVEVWKGKSR